MRIIVLGYIIRGPLGGLCWHYLQYLIGLKKLGHELLFLEDSDDYPSCYSPELFETTKDPDYGLRFITRLFKRYDLYHNWAYYDEHTNQWFGKSKAEVNDFCATADLVLNISNMNPLREWWIQVPRRVLLDTDPAFTQIRHLEEQRYRLIAENHTHFFSFGENFGKEGCRIPEDGFKWKPTRQPVVTELWEVTDPKPDGNWTTVMQWDSYKARQYNGMTFGMKSMAFDAYLGLPQRSNDKFELAVGGETTPVEQLEAGGWKLSNPLIVALNPMDFQQYIQRSKGEFSIAKHGYVVSNSGWFSERSAGYLATGKPVLLQDTGFTQCIETGRGLFAFTCPADVLAAIAEINADYSKHCGYARQVAEAYFDSDKVLTAMLNDMN